MGVENGEETGRLRQLIILLALLPLCGQANQCFNFAETYYQQIYCEIKADGQGAGLPSFADFRRNEEQMQALLLKPFARRAGIVLRMPGRREVVAKVAETPPLSEAKPVAPDSCEPDGLRLVCVRAVWQLVVNQPNDKLSEGALSDDRRMALPPFRGDRSQVAEVSRYLVESYHHYLEKMMAIGLGGSTLAYGKFAYLFEDLTRRGVSFEERFEVMYRYLKADKRRLSVPVRKSLPDSLDTGKCFGLKNLFVCQAGVTNLVFSRAE